MADISFELLEILDAIERRGSFAAAAEELGRVPSALSYSIQKQEERLGLTLFTREGRRAVFTPAGRLLLEEGRQLLAAAGGLADQARTLATGWEPRLRLAVDSLVPMAAVMAVVAEFLGDHPTVELDVREEVLGGAWEALIQDRVDLVVGAPAPRPRVGGLRVEPLGVVERVFAVSAEHPLARHLGPLTTAELADHRTVVVHDSSRSAVPRATRILNPDRHFYVQTMAQKLAAQRAGIGAGFVPRRAVAPLLASGEMVALEVADVDTRDELFLAWKVASRGRGLRDLVARLQAAELPL